MFDTLRNFFSEWSPFAHRCHACSTILRRQKAIHEKLKIIMQTQIELTDQLTKVSTQLDKISAESTKNLQAIKDLQEIIDNGPAVSPDLQQAVDRLTAQAQTLDDLTPDIPEEEPKPTAPMRSKQAQPPQPQPKPESKPAKK